MTSAALYWYGKRGPEWFKQKEMSEDKNNDFAAKGLIVDEDVQNAPLISDEQQQLPINENKSLWSIFVAALLAWFY